MVESHIDQLERYIWENISLSGLQTEADLKRRILNLYEKDAAAGKNAKGIRNYARNDWQNTPTASNIYQTTLNDIRAGQQELLDEINTISNYDDLRDYKAERDYTSYPSNIRNALKAAEARVRQQGVMVYEGFSEALKGPTEAVERMREEDLDKDIKYNELKRAIDRIDLREIEPELTRAQYNDLRRQYTQARQVLRNARSRM